MKDKFILVVTVVMCMLVAISSCFTVFAENNGEQSSEVSQSQQGSSEGISQENTQASSGEQQEFSVQQSTEPTSQEVTEPTTESTTQQTEPTEQTTNTEPTQPDTTNNDNGNNQDWFNSGDNFEIIVPTTIVEDAEPQRASLVAGIISWCCVFIGVFVIIIVLRSTNTDNLTGSTQNIYSNSKHKNHNYKSNDKNYRR